MRDYIIVLALFASVLFRSVPIFKKIFSQSKSFENRINGSKKLLILFDFFLIDMISWEQTEQIKYDFSVQFMPFFNWLKKLSLKSDQIRSEQK